MLEILEKFSPLRNKFIHHRFSSATNINDVFKEGFSVGTNLIKFFDKYSIMTSRGCPFNCSFCCSTLGKVWRKRTPENVIDEIKMAIKKYKIKMIQFIDPSINIIPERVIQICELMLRDKIDIPWSAQGVRADLITDKLVKIMKEAGCKRLYIGIESLDPEVYAEIGKSETIEEIKRGIRIAKNNGLEVYGFLIIGLPKDNFKKKYADNALLAQAFSKDWSYVDRIAAGRRLAEEGDIDKLSPEYKDVILNDALSYSPGSVKDILRADPSLITHDGNERALEFLLKDEDKQSYLSGSMGTDEAREKATNVLMKEVVRPKDIANYDRNFFLDPDYGEARRKYAVQNWGANYWNEIATNPKFDKEVYDQLNQTADGIELEKIARDNPAYLRARASNPAVITAFGPIKKGGTTYDTSKKVNRLIEQAKNNLPSFTPEEEATIERIQRTVPDRHKAEIEFMTIQNDLGRMKKGLTKSTGPTSRADAIKFRGIADGRTTLPKGTDQKTLETIRGSLRAAFYEAQKSRNEIGKVALERRNEQQKPTPDQAVLNAFDTDLKDLELKAKRYENRYTVLKNEEYRIKGTLGIP